MGDESCPRRSHRNRNVSCLFWEFCPAGSTLDKTWPREDTINNRDNDIDLLWNLQSVGNVILLGLSPWSTFVTSWDWRKSHNFSLCRNALHPTACGLCWEILSPSVTLLCCSGGIHPTTHRQPSPCHCLPYEWTLLMCGWLIRQKQ